jgi:hypothetical protein
LINNRQGGRRRGRGGQRGPTPGGNRQDNRQRGNAAQLLEKYKSMARDAQLAGDRVQSEYFLQFADHYFRVLDEGRARFEEQRRQRGDDSSDDSDNDGNVSQASDYDRTDDDNRGQRDNLARSEEDGGGDNRRQRGNGSGGDRSRRSAAPQPQDEDERIPVEVLPPAIGREPGDGEEASQKPRRRTRRSAGDGDEADIAPAA